MNAMIEKAKALTATELKQLAVAQAAAGSIDAASADIL